MQARRYNKGKIRYSLIDPFILKELAKVYTLGAHKYSLYLDKNGNTVKGQDIPFNESNDYTLLESGADNWRNGLPVSELLDSAERHIQQCRNNEDEDELGSLHLANAMWNLGTAMYFIEKKPSFDDRKKWWQNFPKIALDIDGVLAGLEEAYLGNNRTPATDWDDPRFKNEDFLSKIQDDTFMLSLPVIDSFNFPIVGYVTARGVDTSTTQQWLDKHLFPSKPIVTVGLNKSKVEAVKELGADIFVDDSIYNFIELNNAGVTCYLRTRPHNEKYNVGTLRISNLNELFNKLK